MKTILVTGAGGAPAEGVINSLYIAEPNDTIICNIKIKNGNYC